ncbi:MAG: SDR family oxidoreductase [Chitinophagaceae bacterium]|nr:SDR family oxidoreductase [Chitinophagaceae bacterium]
MDDLKNKVVVITGASSGVGKAMALEFAKYGAKLVLAARRIEALHEVAEECRELGGTAEAVECDTRISQDVQVLAKVAYESGNAIDVWINNAGVLAAGALDEVPSTINENVIRTNLLGYMNGAQEALPYFKSQGHGVLINNISVGGWFPVPYATAYSASKFGLRGFSEALKGEVSKYPGIHIVDIFPGFLDTPGIQHAANYTGKVLKPAPPVSDPRRVARAVVKLVKNPSSRKTIGIASGLLRMSYAVVPRIARGITGMVIRKYLKQADDIDHTSGNVLRPVDYGTGIDGGWRNKGVSREATIAMMIFAGVATGLYYARSRK